ncbi:hypothetical protein ACQP3F_30465, partial [Escherichia coli]
KKQGIKGVKEGWGGRMQGRRQKEKNHRWGNSPQRSFFALSLVTGMGRIMKMRQASKVIVI